MRTNLLQERMETLEFMKQIVSRCQHLSSLCDVSVERSETSAGLARRLARILLEVGERLQQLRVIAGYELLGKSEVNADPTMYRLLDLLHVADALFLVSLRLHHSPRERSRIEEDLLGIRRLRRNVQRNLELPSFS